MAASTITSRSGGPRVVKLQKAVNGKLGARKFSWRKIPVDGHLKRPTDFDAIHLAAWMLGFSPAQLKRIHRGRVTRHVELILRGEKARTPQMKRRDKQRRDDAATLRRRHRLNKRRRVGGVGLLAVNIHSVAPGRKHWGGSADIMGQLVAPFLYSEYGLTPGSGKRTPRRNSEVGGSPNSDHLTTKLLTFARDFPTWDGEAAARALAAQFGWRNWRPNSYDYHYFSVSGVRFRIQILWGAAIDHDDHIHVGIELL